MSPDFALDLGALDFPVVLGRRGDAVAVVAQADLVGRDERFEGFLDRGELRVGIDGRVECRRDVLGGAMDALDELQKTDGLANRRARVGGHLAGDRGDLAPDLAVDVRLDQVIDLVNAGELADRLIGEVDRRVDEDLLGELDNRPVRPAHMLADPTLGPQAGDDLDDEVDLVGQERVEVDEPLGGQLGEADVGGQVARCRRVVPGSPRTSLAGAVWAPAFLERTRLLVTSEMSDGSR